MALLFISALYTLGYPIMTWAGTPSVPQFHIVIITVVIIALCYSLTMLYVGMRFLDFTDRWLDYARQAVLPFFVIHQPVIIVIAFFVVQWNASIEVKLPIVVLSSFAVSLGLYELLISRIRPLQLIFGVKPQARPARVETGQMLSPHPG